MSESCEKVDKEESSFPEIVRAMLEIRHERFLVTFKFWHQIGKEVH